MMKGLDDDIHRTLARNKEIVECRRQIQLLKARLTELEAEHRREQVLASLDIDPRGTWKELSRGEKQDKEYVLKALSCTPFIFGDYGPPPAWSYHVPPSLLNNDEEELPEQFWNDRDAMLTFLSRDDFSWYFRRSLFAVPVSLRDDKEIVMQMCRKSSAMFVNASIRLRDDEDVVLAMLQDKDRYNIAYSEFWHVSHRLKSDVSFMLKAVATIAVDKGFVTFRLLEHAKLSAEEEKRVSLAILNLLPSDQCYDPVWKDCISPVLRDDSELMMPMVKLNWRALEYCSERLRRCERVVAVATSQNASALQFALGSSYEKEYGSREKHVVLDELENRVISFSAVPEHFKNDQDVLIMALEQGLVDYKDLASDQKESRDLIVAASKHDDYDNLYTELLPAHLKKDEKLCLQLLESGYDWPNAMLENVPSLRSSRKAVMAMTKLPFEAWGEDLSSVIRQCPFRDDTELMLSACEQNGLCLQYASERLLADCTFMCDVLSRSADAIIIQFVAKDFFAVNADLVLDLYCLKHGKDYQCYCTETDGLTDDYWEIDSIVMACLKKGWSVLQRLDASNPLLDDATTVKLAVRNDPLQFQYASRRLKGDREFVLSLAKINGQTIKYAGEHLKRDEDILAAAVATSIGVIMDCFDLRSHDDFEFLVSFASRIRTKLELYDNFMRLFLTGISVVRPQQAPAVRCRLPLLDRGMETSVAFKKAIALFAGIPLGAELSRLCDASVNLKKLGL